MATSETSRQHAEPPWHRRSELYAHESQIRSLRADGYSLAQILRLLNLPVHRSTLHRWLRRQHAAAARPAGEPALAAPPAALGAVDSTEAAADDAAAEALLAATDFSPPTSSSRK